jgi:hypothetical protein
MPPKISAHTGIVVGYTTRIFSAENMAVNPLETRVLKAHVGGYVQVWLNGSLAFAKCHPKIAHVALPDQRRPTLDEVMHVMRAIQNEYPEGSRVELSRQSSRARDGRYEVRGVMEVNHTPQATEAQTQTQQTAVSTSELSDGSPWAGEDHEAVASAEQHID